MQRLPKHVLVLIGKQLKNNKNLASFAQVSNTSMSALRGLLNERKYNKYVRRGNALHVHLLQPGTRRALRNLANRGVGHRYVMEPLHLNNKKIEMLLANQLNKTKKGFFIDPTNNRNGYYTLYGNGTLRYVYSNTNNEERNVRNVLHGVRYNRKSGRLTIN